MSSLEQEGQSPRKPLRAQATSRSTKSGPRMMAYPAAAGRSLGTGAAAPTSVRPWLVIAGFAAAPLLMASLWGLPALSTLPPSPSPQAQGPVAVATGGPLAAAGSGATPSVPPSARTSRPGPATTARPSFNLRPPASPLPAPSREPGAAPHEPAEFDLGRQVIQLAFPLKEASRYRYRDNWLDAREGDAEHYNHAHARHSGRLTRAHDGIDIYARRGEPVVAVFDGVMIDPADRWQPWDRERYGLTAVIISEEAATAGYAALYSHLDRLWVEPGQPVQRGEVLGTIGSTGNAEGGPAHLHFELRAPFTLDWLQLGEERSVDAFNPYPSLVAADPDRAD